MNFIYKHKALLLTILVFSLLLLVLYNWHLSNNSRKKSEFLVDLDAFTKAIQQKKEKSQESKEEENSVSEKVQTHRAFNQNSEARKANFDKKLNEIFEKNSASQTETSQNNEISTSGNYTIGKASLKNQKQSDGTNNSNTLSTKSGSLKNSSISFNLLGRTAVSIPNPIYTCNTGGKIVINIRVNQAGRVIGTSFNEASSSTDNKCLVENALLYASEAIFSELLKKDNQPGTITYQFKP